MKVAKILWLVPCDGVWYGKVELGGKKKRVTLTRKFVCLAPWVKFDESGHVTDVGEVSRKAASVLAREMPKISDNPNEWQYFDWENETGLVQAVCKYSWLSAEDLNNIDSFRPVSVLNGYSARATVEKLLFPVFGGNYYFREQWCDQVEAVTELFHPDTPIQKGEPIQGENTDILVTTCPLTYEYYKDLFMGILFIDENFCGDAPEVCTIVGLEDATLMDLIVLLSVLQNSHYKIMHRWDARQDVPFRGDVSPPMALELCQSLGVRIPNGNSIGEFSCLYTEQQIKAAQFVALKTCEPAFGYVRESEFVCEGDTVLDSKTAKFYVVTKITSHTKENVKLGMVYGSGPATLVLRCGNKRINVSSDSPRLSWPTERPRMGKHYLY